MTATAVAFRPETEVPNAKTIVLTPGTMLPRLVELVAEEVIMAEVEEDIVVAEELPEELAKPEGTLMGLETAFSMDTKADIEAIFGNILS